MSRHRRQQRKRARRGPARTLADFGVELNLGEGTFAVGVEYQITYDWGASWGPPIPDVRLGRLCGMSTPTTVGGSFAYGVLLP